MLRVGRGVAKDVVEVSVFAVDTTLAGPALTLPDEDVTEIAFLFKSYYAFDRLATSVLAGPGPDALRAGGKYIRSSAWFLQFLRAGPLCPPWHTS